MSNKQNQPKATAETTTIEDALRIIRQNSAIIASAMYDPEMPEETSSAIIELCGQNEDCTDRMFTTFEKEGKILFLELVDRAA